MSILFAQDRVVNPVLNDVSRGGIEAPFPSSVDQLEFTVDEEEYFGEELQLPGEPLPEPVVRVAEDKKVKIDTIIGEEGAWQIVFQFPKNVSYTEALDECGGLNLTFNQEVDTPDLIKLQDKLAYILKRVSNGYRSLYLLPERPVCFYTQANENHFVLDIIPQYDYPVKATRLLKLARSRLLVEEYYYAQAFDALDDLLTEYPGDKDALLLLGTLENLLPRWQKSVEIFCDLRKHYPYDDNIQALLHDVYFPHSSYLNFTREIQSTKNFSAYQFNRLQGEWIVNYTPCNVLYVGGFVQRTRGHLSSVVNDDGAVEGFLGTRYLGSAYLRNETVWGDAYTGRLYFGEGIVFGAGMEATWLWPGVQGEFTLVADWNRPYWELFEAFTFYGRQDRALFRINGVYDRFFNWNFGGGGERIGITDVPTALASALVSGEIFWHLKVGNPIVSFNYGYDGHYVLFEKEKTGPLGNRFIRVPLSSYEFHFLRAYLQWEFCDHWFFSSFGGGSFNRLGTNDWTIGASLVYRKPCPCGWEAEVAYTRFPSTTVLGASTEFVTFSITARF